MATAPAERCGKSLPVSPRIGVLRFGAAAESQTRAFRTGLQELGYVEGQNIAVEYRHAEGDFERLPELATELIGLEVGLIVAGPAGRTRATWAPPGT